MRIFRSSLMVLTTLLLSFGTARIVHAETDTAATGHGEEPHQTMPRDDQTSSEQTNSPSQTPQPSVVPLNQGESSHLASGCSRTCLYVEGQMVPNGNGAMGMKAQAGLMIQFSNSQDRITKENAKAQRDRLIREETVSLLEKMAQAIRTGQQEDANAIAIVLFKRLGYPDHHHLLRDIKGRSN